MAAINADDDEAAGCDETARDEEMAISPGAVATPEELGVVAAAARGILLWITNTDGGRLIRFVTRIGTRVAHAELSRIVEGIMLEFSISCRRAQR